MKYETRLEMLKLSDIVAAPYNPREDIERGSDEYKALRRSIELNGMVEPPVVNLHNMRCIGGNPVSYTHLTDGTGKAHGK